MECNKVCDKEAEEASMAPENVPLQYVMPAPKCMQDGSAAVTEKMEEVNLNDDPAVPKYVSVSANLSSEERVASKTSLPGVMRICRD